MNAQPDNAIDFGQRPSQSIIYVSPEMARRVLAKNTRNRPLSELHVQRLMHEMESGRWTYNGEAIKWSIDEALLDGQHRLTALSRMPDDFPPIPLLVVRGLAPQAQDTMDQGRKRTAADQLAIGGLAGHNNKIIAGAIRVYVPWQNGLIFRDAKSQALSNPEVVEWARDNPVRMAMLDDLATTMLRRVKARPSVTLAVMLALREANDDAQRLFAELLYTGAGLEIGSPILALRERLDRISQSKVREPDRDIIAFFVTAWNAYLAGRSLSKLQRPKTGAWTVESFPEVAS